MSRANMHERSNIFLQMHPLQRLLISLAITAIVYLLIRQTVNGLLAASVLWSTFALCYLIMMWIIICTRSISQIRKTAKKDDGSKFYVFILILISSFASMVTVLLLMLSQSSSASKDDLFVPAAISGMLLSWAMVHTIFIFHYAHIYYDDDEKDATKDAGGLDFPGDENPDYLDFAYFSFVLGCTFQVSDVEITSKILRRIALVHGLLAFLLNTFVVALTINLIAGLTH